ncbi:hypothetical protein Hesp01_47040 [Herbidospora sp. NBRC 101105]|nr:hypothetical protein Hesp01_47040 [Herbidospora sp. NBRC 101105]
MQIQRQERSAQNDPARRCSLEPAVRSKRLANTNIAYRDAHAARRASFPGGPYDLGDPFWQEVRTPMGLV